MALEKDHLRVNSIFKHIILKEYLYPWAAILSSRNSMINYIDCYAGPGEYKHNSSITDGSPIVAVKAFKELLESDWIHKPKKANLLFNDINKDNLDELAKIIKKSNLGNPALNITMMHDSSENLVSSILNLNYNLAPTFFFVDPYGNPFPLKLMRKIMKFKKTELFVNFMYFEILKGRGWENKHANLDKIYGDGLLEIKKFNEESFLKYVYQEIGAKYYIPFYVNYGPDEKPSSNRLKYILAFYTNNFLGFDTMLNTMWKCSESSTPLMVSDGQPLLFKTKNITELKKYIISKYCGKKSKISFDVLREANWFLHFREIHFRKVIKDLEKESKLQIQRVSSKKNGLKKYDLVCFD